jgi:hypothetical protein
MSFMHTLGGARVALRWEDVSLAVTQMCRPCFASRYFLSTLPLVALRDMRHLAMNKPCTRSHLGVVTFLL